MDHLRLFTAVRPPENVLAAIRNARDSVRELAGTEPIRWVREENFHVTLHFLGATPVAMVDEVAATIETSAGQIAAPMDLALTGVGAFPNARRPRTLWVGVEDRNRRLTELERLMREGMRNLDFELDERPFRPHVTFGYVRNRATAAERAAVKTALHEAHAEHIAFEASEVVLVRSVTGPGGSVYTDLRAIRVGRGTTG